MRRLLTAAVLAIWRRRTSSHERGQVLAMVGLMLTILIASVALTTDYGLWLNARRSYQNAVDAAVLAGGAQLQRPTTNVERQLARQEAWSTLERELDLGPTDIDEASWSGSDTPANAPRVVSMPDGFDYSIWVSTPPIGAGAMYNGLYAEADSRTIFVRVSRQRPLFFGRIVTTTAPDVSAWATAGTHPNRFAVITLRQNGDPENGNPTDIDIGGGTTLTVKDGDLGGNWGLAISGSGSKVLLEPDDAKVYLAEPSPGQSGGNSWTTSQIINSSGTYVPPTFYAEIPDPSYPAPCLDYSPSGCLADRGSVTVNNSSPSTRAGEDCPPGTAVRLAPGRYDNISLRLNKCAILDPTFDPVAGKNNGIYYITGTLDLNNDALLIGNGVTVVFDEGADMNMNAGATISLNSEDTNCHGSGADCKFAAWTVFGRTNWTPGTSPVYTAPTDPNDRGIAMMVLKDTAPATDIIQMSSGSGIDFRGIIYAPWDNIKLSGQPQHRDLGQTIGWTLSISGGVEFEQHYDGPVDERPRLLEPTVGQ